MILAITVLLTALLISAVAIYYSVVGLVAIFASAAIPIIIMGTVLESAKLVTAVWLHKYWKRTTWWLKTYLVMAVVILMMITSMGIFGFLSKAHIDQTSIGNQSQAQIAKINSKIQRQELIQTKAEEKITQAQTVGLGADVNIQKQIDTEQIRIDRAYDRLAIAQESYEKLASPINKELLDVKNSLSTLNAALSSNNIALTQTIVGINADGLLGTKTTERIDQFKSNSNSRISELESQLIRIRESSSTISNAEQQISDGNALIIRLRSQLGQQSAADINAVIQEQRTIVSNTEQTIEDLVNEKFTIETNVRQLEAKVGPIKYLAEFIYGSSNTNTLEDAVRWMIVIIIFVFDPLAVLLLIASQQTFKYHKEDKANISAEIKLDPEFYQDSSVTHRDLAKTNEVNLANTFEHYDKTLEDTIPDIKIETEEEQARENLYEMMDTDLTMKAKKQSWKEAHPNETIKEFKNAFIKGYIDKLPWDADD